MRTDCTSACTFEPVALFSCTQPGIFCEAHGAWSTVRRSDFKRKFGFTFGVFLRDHVKVDKRTVREQGRVVSVTTMNHSVVMSGRRVGVGGSAKDRRKQRRAAQSKGNPEPMTTTAEPTCVTCGQPATGTCENCEADICPDHESGKYSDVYTCKDEAACSARIEANATATAKA